MLNKMDNKPIKTELECEVAFGLPAWFSELFYHGSGLATLMEDL